MQEVKNMAGWEHGLFGCFSNIGLCIFGWLLPCYVHGKTAEAVGSSCCLCALIFCFTVPFSVCVIRGRVRESKNIGGGMLGDFICSLFCFPLVICQSAQEMSVQVLGAGESMGQSMARE